MDSRVLLFSQRAIDPMVFSAWKYEFEDVIAAVDRVDVVLAADRRGSQAARFFGRARTRAARLLHLTDRFYTGLRETQLQRSYDLFFAACAFPSQIPAVHAIRNWRKRCRLAVCYLGEFWPAALQDPRQRAYLRLLREFDVVFSHCAAADVLSRFIGRPCHHLPVGVDTVRFCPPSLQEPRPIDVYSMGRRSAPTHRALLELAKSRGIFYLYDTATHFPVMDYGEHRELLANLVRRSAFFIAYSHNTNIAGITGGQEELGSRLFEGAAGGSVMLGSAPACQAFDEHFDWPDSVIRIPADCPQIGEVMEELRSQPARLALARKNNVVNCLLRHDWVWRWDRILDALDLDRAPPLAERMARLEQSAGLLRAARESVEVQG